MSDGSEDSVAKAISSDVRAELASVPHSYFAAVDRLDVDDVLSHTEVTRMLRRIGANGRPVAIRA